MLENVTGESIATEVEMVRTAFPDTIVILEGNNDSMLFENFFDSHFTHIIIAHGKDNAISAIEIVNDSAGKGILAIVDADFWRVEGLPDLPDNILVSDTHDVEGMLFNSNAFSRVVSEYCSPRKIIGYDNLKDFFYSKSSMIGIFRLISQRNNFHFVFHELNYQKFTNKSTLEIDIDKMVRYVQDITQQNAAKHNYELDLPQDAEIITLINQVMENEEDLDKLELSCGHDLLGLFALSLRKLFATLQASIAENGNIHRLFRLAYSINDFVLTNLYQEIEQWELNSNPFKILKNDLKPEQNS